jgi:DNA-binding NarL/FixJ family response regulator
VEQPVTVAVVDGNSGTRRELIRLLGQVPGISVVGEAEDSEEALRMAGDRRPDVVVTDVRWIAPDGATFLRRLARSAPEAGIVILTAYFTERERNELMLAGAGVILLKEIGSETLVRTIRTVAEERRLKA